MSRLVFVINTMQVYLLSEVIPSQGLIFSCYAKFYTLSTISSCSSQPFTQIKNKMVHGIFVCMPSKTWNIRQYRGWCIKFVTGLNITIGIVQKVYEWSSCPFAKNDSPIRESFWQNNSLVTHILFELCLLWYLVQSQIWCITLYIREQH